MVPATVSRPAAATAFMTETTSAPRSRITYEANASPPMPSIVPTKPSNRPKAPTPSALDAALVVVRNRSSSVVIEMPADPSVPSTADDSAPTATPAPRPSTSVSSGCSAPVPVPDSPAEALSSVAAGSIVKLKLPLMGWASGAWTVHRTPVGPAARGGSNPSTHRVAVGSEST